MAGLNVVVIVVFYIVPKVAIFVTFIPFKAAYSHTNENQENMLLDLVKKKQKR